jgi:hypothetical protein
MKSLAFVFALLATTTACYSRSARGVLPTHEGPPPAADVTIVWVGYGAAERMEEGRWTRRPEFDYEFTVEQRRYPDHWESVKHLRRRHPAYDGSAGPREQTYYFRLELASVAGDGRIPIRITSTLGPGEGAADREYRTADLVLHPDVSRFAPFDTYRIAQAYDYEKGTLSETVSLDDGASPWVRNQESAVLFAATQFQGAPTRR